MKRWIHSSTSRSVKVVRSGNRYNVVQDGVELKSFSLLKKAQEYAAKLDPTFLDDPIEFSTNIKDEYNVKQYLPKRCISQIDEIDMVPDFDNRSGRTVHRYYAYFKDGSEVTEVGLSGFIKAVKDHVDHDVIQ